MYDYKQWDGKMNPKTYMFYECLKADVRFMRMTHSLKLDEAKNYLDELAKRRSNETK